MSKKIFSSYPPPAVSQNGHHTSSVEGGKGRHGFSQLVPRETHFRNINLGQHPNGDGEWV